MPHSKLTIFMRSSAVLVTRDRYEICLTPPRPAAWNQLKIESDWPSQDNEFVDVEVKKKNKVHNC